MAKSPQRAESFLTVDQVAERLQTAPRTVRRWIESGDLVAHRLGRLVRISEADLAVFLQMRRGPE